MSFYIDDALVVCGLRLDELDFPEGAAVALVVRGDRLVAPRGGTRSSRATTCMWSPRRRTGRSSN